MNKKYLYGTLVASLFAFTGCTDLDTLPEGNTITPSQIEEVLANDPSKAEAGVNAIFSQFSYYLPNYNAFGGSRHNDFGFLSIPFFTEGNGLDVVSEDNGYNWAGNNLDFGDRDITSYECRVVWNDLYKMIATANSVVSRISVDTEDPTSQFYLAQGVAMRAFCYWNLAQLYQFNYEGNQTKPCVPIVTDENAEDVAAQGGPRATVQEVYDLISSDINLAIDLLAKSESGDFMRADKRYINQAVAYGLRARIKLTMHDYAGAAADATSAISMSTAQPASIADVSVPAFWTANEGNWMWAVIVAETDEVVESTIVNWSSHMNSLNYGYVNYMKGRQINKALFQSIPGTDVRKGWWLDENKTSPNLSTDFAAAMAGYKYPAYTEVKFAPYNNVAKTTTNANDFPLMRIEEMYLIKAEGEAMSGGNGKATLENFVSTYRDPSYTFAGTSATEVQNEVIRQRRIELWAEGFSWYDIMRLNRGIDRRGAGYPNATMVFNIAPGSGIMLWRIPQAEIEANPAISEADNNPSAPTPTPVSE